MRQVFNPIRRPWINLTGAEADTAIIIETVRKCPSGALSYVQNEELVQKPVY